MRKPVLLLLLAAVVTTCSAVSLEFDYEAPMHVVPEVSFLEVLEGSNPSFDHKQTSSAIPSSAKANFEAHHDCLPGQKCPQPGGACCKGGEYCCMFGCIDTEPVACKPNPYSTSLQTAKKLLQKERDEDEHAEMIKNETPDERSARILRNARKNFKKHRWIVVSPEEKARAMKKKEEARKNFEMPIDTTVRGQA